jgi:hypothetical protein
VSHARTAIRSSAVTAVTGLTTTGQRVYNTRIFPLAESNLPCLAVYTGDEGVERHAIGGLLERQLELIVMGYAKGVSGVEDTLDAMAGEVEAAVTALTGAKDVVIRSLRTEYDGEGEVPLASVELIFTVVYYTDSGVPGTAL